MYDGIEVDTISLGDADCAVVTQWHNSCPHRVLIDGGSGADAATVIDFLHSRGYTELWAALCTHLHNDHARGLIKIARNNSITISNGWMHDIRAHVRADVLRRACADDGVRQVVETTTELAAAFDGRHIPRQEPFAGNMIAGWPHMTVLGPSLQFYDRIIADFTNVEPPARPTSGLALALAAQNARTPFARIPAPPGNTSLSALFSRMSPAEIAPFPGNTSLAALLSRPPSPNHPPFFPLTGVLTRSSVKTNPTTQPFNNTSTIVGVMLNKGRLLFTADAGSEALGQVPAEWHSLLYMGVPHHGSDGNLSQQDIERFCPSFAVISACGDLSHPSRAIVSGLVKVGATVCSTHKSGNLCFWSGSVPPRADYGPAEVLRGTGEPEPVPEWLKMLSGR